MAGQENEALAQYSEAAHAHLVHMPAALDLKISIFSASLLAVLIFALQWFSEHYVHGHHLADLDVSGWISIGGILLLGAGMAASGFALRLHAHGQANNPFSVHGFAAHASDDAMLAKLRDRSPQQLLEDRLLHCREVAIVSVLKGQWFHRAFLCGMVGVVMVVQGFVV